MVRNNLGSLLLRYISVPASTSFPRGGTGASCLFRVREFFGGTQLEPELKLAIQLRLDSFMSSSPALDIAQTWSTELLVELFLRLPYQQIVHSREVSMRCLLHTLSATTHDMIYRSAADSRPLSIALRRCSSPLNLVPRAIADASPK